MTVSRCAICVEKRPGEDGVCLDCSTGAVDDIVQARFYLARVIRTVAGAGYTPVGPVDIQLHDVLQPSFEVNKPSGLTHLVTYSDSITVERIEVISGLSPFYFGRVLAHELGHAWLAQHGRSLQDRRLCEGFAELVERAWLLRLKVPRGNQEAEDQLGNPDPIYGGGLRLVMTAVEAVGEAAVVQSLLQKGSLPNFSKRRPQGGGGSRTSGRTGHSNGTSRAPLHRRRPR